MVCGLTVNDTLYECIQPLSHVIMDNNSLSLQSNHTQKFTS